MEQYYTDWEKNGRDLTQSYDKSPYNNRNVKGANWQHKTPPKRKFDYIAIADRLRTVSLSNYIRPAGVVNKYTDPTFHLPATNDNLTWLDQIKLRFQRNAVLRNKTKETFHSQNIFFKKSMFRFLYI